MPEKNVPKPEKKNEEPKKSTFINPFRPGTACYQMLDIGRKGFTKWDDLKDAVTAGKSQADFMRDYSRMMFTVVTKDGKIIMVPTVPDPVYLKEHDLTDAKVTYKIG